MHKKRAVFARNHKQYLEKACELSNKNPLSFVSFRLSKRWVSAENALRNQSPITIFFAEIGGKGLITHKATLHNVILNPKENKGEAEKWLSFGLTETGRTREDLLSGAKTIY